MLSYQIEHDIKCYLILIIMLSQGLEKFINDRGEQLFETK